MAKVNITEASKLAGISRSYFHRKYIKPGLISVSVDSHGKRTIETSELIRVFGDLKSVPVHTEDTVNSTQQVTLENTLEITDQIALAELKVENRMLKEQMLEMKENYSSQLRLLEHIVDRRKSWWMFWK